VVLLIGLEKGEHREALHKLISVFGTGKSLQNLLKDQSCDQDLVGNPGGQRGER
jgi:hypothetical protein